MPGNESRLAYLYRIFIDDTGTPEEVREFWALLREVPDDHPIHQAVYQLYEEKIPDNIKERNWDAALMRIFGEQAEQAKPVVRMRKRFAWAAAASIIFLLAAGGYFYFSGRLDKSASAPLAIHTFRDIKAPQSNRASITLAGGKTVFLDSAANGRLADQGTMKLVKLTDGRIAYSGSTEEIAYNTLSNPRGSKVIDMTLADGTRIWLNAGSSVTYPVSFVGKERKVSITGEAYFEVTHNPNMPFVVSKGETNVQVLGTHFNVNAYDDEEDLKVTLLEGSVKVSMVNGQWSMLKPGEQAIINTSPAFNIQHSTFNIDHSPDLEAVMAWKNGFFDFRANNIETVMRQVSRWYDIDVVYEGAKTKDLFSGGITRTANLEQLLKILEYSSVHFKFEGGKLIVLP